MKLLILLGCFFLQQNSLTVKSSAFADGHYIPERYSCQGQNINPEVLIGNFPSNTQSLALIMDDTDSPNGEYDHWIMWNIPPVQKITENSAPGVQGRNSSKQNKYFGPCPPNGVHTYHFKVYALDVKLEMSDTCGKKELIKAMDGHVLASGELKGLFK
ncbi:MAG: YbhB/YbcL family Raf kinase inhibitor-like protein [Bacteroidetes bacterium]|nr:YbhB/YbcL family Raf kinase inhibitor-like protein [Bacteroidota bacterium]